MATINRSDVLAERPVQMRTVLDETRGIFHYDLADLGAISPNDRLSVAQLAQQIGSLLGQQVLPGLGYQSKQKADLGVTPVDRARAGTSNIERGLYIYRDDPRYDNDGDLLITNSFAGGASEFRRLGLKLPYSEMGIFQQPAVVFPEAEYGKIPRHPKALVRQARSQNRTYNAGNSNTQEKGRRPRSAAGKQMAKYVIKTEVLMKQNRDERQLINRIYRQTKERPRYMSSPMNLFAAKNLVQHMARINGMFYETVETAAVNNSWDRPEIHGVHLANIEALYLAPTAAATNEAWRDRLSLQGGYLNARYFKMLQALRECQVYESMYRPYYREVIEERRQAAAKMLGPKRV